MVNPRQKTRSPADVRDKEILSPQEIAEVLGCGRTLAYRLLAENVIPSFYVGRLRRVRREDLERFVEARLRESQP